MGLDASRAEADLWTQKAVMSVEGLPGDTAGLIELAYFAADRDS